MLIHRSMGQFSIGFNPWREAPPRATHNGASAAIITFGFQSLAGSPSTSHPELEILWVKFNFSFNPWREAPPRATPITYRKGAHGISFNPWREAPPRAT